MIMKKTITPLAFLFTGLSISAQEPVLLGDFSTGGADAFRYDYLLDGVTINNQLFFIVDDGIHGEELWRTNGS
ncbi:MAG: hypothetical protein EHM46_03280, partial [Bacteroidetes bacterium]